MREYPSTKVLLEHVVQFFLHPTAVGLVYVWTVHTLMRCDQGKKGHSGKISSSLSDQGLFCEIQWGPADGPSEGPSTVHSTELWDEV